MTESTQPAQSTQPTGDTRRNPWCEDSGHAPNPKHDPNSFCALAWEAGITQDDNPDEWAELKRLVAADKRRDK